MADGHPDSLAFNALDPAVEIKGRGWVYPVRNDGRLSEPSELLGQRVQIDGYEHEVIGVETHPIVRPYRVEMIFGLLVASPH